MHIIVNIKQKSLSPWNRPTWIHSYMDGSRCWPYLNLWYNAYRWRFCCGYILFPYIIFRSLFCRPTYAINYTTRQSWPSNGFDWSWPTQPRPEVSVVLQLNVYNPWMRVWNSMLRLEREEHKLASNDRDFGADAKLYRKHCRARLCHPAY